jgi:tight adherence protein C
MTGYIVLLISVLLSGLAVALLLTDKKYAELTEPLKSKEWPLHEVYGIGLRLLEIAKFDFRNKAANTLRQEVNILYGDKFAEYYLRIVYAQKISLAYCTAMAFAILACFSDESSRLVMLGLGLVLAGTLYYYFTTQSSKKLSKRSDRFRLEFPNAVSAIALLVNAGMPLRDAWEEVSLSGNEELYVQMQQVNEDIRNGMSEMDAFYAFANRCATPEIKKFIAIVLQGLEKGSKDLSAALKNQTEELWESKKQAAIRQGDLAASKLLIPIMLMFVGILIMVMGPIMTNMGL